MKQSPGFLFNSAIFLLYLCVVLFALHNHELWGDEIHSWNIAKGSHSLSDLFHNIRYEGHPPFWYLCLFGVTQLSHSLIFLKTTQLIFVVGAAIVMLFFSPFSRIQKVLLLSGYYFVFEYAALARNYMPAIFFAFCIAAIYYREFKYLGFCYYLFLLLLSNVHLLGLMLAVSIHSGFCFDTYKVQRNIGVHLILGMLVFLPAVYFILPPADSQLNVQFWKDQWVVSRLYLFAAVIVRAFFPLQEWFNQHWWNTSFLLDNDSILFRIFSVLVFIGLLSLVYIGARKSKTAFVILSVNLLLTFFLTLFFPLNTSRYVGFVFIGYIIAAWFSYKDQVYSFSRNIFMLLTLLQVPSGIFALAKDAKEEFSAAEKVVVMNREIPKEVFVATDYWCLNSLSAYLDSPFYCVELKRSVSFLTWNGEMKSVIHFNYVKALDSLLTNNHDSPFYFYSRHPLSRLLTDDPSKGNLHMLIAGDSGKSVEKSSRVYLYRVERQ